MLNQKSTAVLVMELLYEEEAKRWPSVVNPDEIHIDEILAILEQRAECPILGGVENRIAWFLGESSPLSDHDKARVARLMELKNGTRKFGAVFDEILMEVKKSSQ